MRLPPGGRLDSQAVRLLQWAMLKEALSLDVITTDLQGNDKNEVIGNLLELICRSGKVKDASLALADVLSHEKVMSTGMEHGIAIPHAKTSAVDQLVACVGISRRKIDFESLDRKPARIFIMTLSPKGDAGPHVRFLSEISRLLRDKKTCKALLGATNNQDVLAILTATAPTATS